MTKILFHTWHNGGKNGEEKRFPLHYGATEEYIIYGVMKDRLPLGAFERTKCIKTKTFERWMKGTKA